MLLTIVIPVYNEAQGLPLLMTRLRSALRVVDCEYEVLFVNDGSTDDTTRVLAGMADADFHIKVLAFTRNFGHQAAITAGLDFADGDAVVIMDADLQDPPELLPEMLRLIEQGYDVISGQRQNRPGDGLFKRGTAAGFYWFMQRFVDRRLKPEVGDFRMFSRTAVLALRQFREQHRFMRGIVAWMGLKEAVIPFQRDNRACGETKYPVSKMLQLAWTAISSFSAFPLRLSTAAGVLMTLFGAVFSLYSLFAALITKTVVPGWTSIICIQIVFSGAILLAVGLVGSYVARIYEETKGRPLYVLTRPNAQWISTGLPSRGLVLTSPAFLRDPDKPLSMPVRRGR